MPGKITQLERREVEDLIARIVAKVSKATQHTVEWHETWPLDGQRFSATFEVRALRAFGSYARGATVCGDLDLIIEVASDARPLPPSRVVKSSVVGRMSNVDIQVDFEGTVGERKRERFSESVLLWSPNLPDWRTNVAEIRAMAGSLRFDRKTDSLPVALHQLNIASLEQAERMVDQIDTGILTSTWLPIDAIVPTPETWPGDLKRHAKRLEEQLGRETRKVVPYVCQYIAERVRETIWRTRMDRCALHISQFYAYMGRPPIDVSALERADASAVILAPHHRKGFAPGLWILQRGPEHRVVKAFEQLNAWVESRSGIPSLIHFRREHRYNDEVGIYVLELPRRGGQV